MVQVFRSNAFLAADDEAIAYGFFGRGGGVSGGSYDSLNCGIGSSDDLARVMENRGRVAESLGLKRSALPPLYQVHGDVCLRVDEPWAADHRPEADAFVTDRAGVGLGVLTADCAPVLFYADGVNGPVIGAAHAGWRGAIGGVLQSVIRMMCSYEGVEASGIRACVGPCIGRASYEVSLDFAEPFMEQDDACEAFFSAAPQEGKLLFDLPGYCAFVLAEAGVKAVSILDEDTYTQDDAFFSYRRASHRCEGDCGRQISVIAIR